MKTSEDIHMCKLNTTGTINKRYRINDTVWLCVGYSNAPSFTNDKHNSKQTMPSIDKW